MRIQNSLIAALLMLLGFWPAEAAMRLAMGRGGQAHTTEEESVSLVLPPMIETLNYTARGELQEDGFWDYEWDGAGRLVEMTRRRCGPRTHRSTGIFVFRRRANNHPRTPHEISASGTSNRSN